MVFVVNVYMCQCVCMFLHNHRYCYAGIIHFILFHVPVPSSFVCSTSNSNYSCCSTKNSVISHVAAQRTM